jgi:hypothetical protein
MIGGNLSVTLLQQSGRLRISNLQSHVGLTRAIALNIFLSERKLEKVGRLTSADQAARFTILTAALGVSWATALEAVRKAFSRNVII